MFVAALLLVVPCLAPQESKKHTPLVTRFAKDVTPQNAHTEYPRPQFVRDAWQCLNGEWDYAITKADAKEPTKYEGKILVPFPIESKLSGVERSLGDDDALWYRRTFEVPAAWNGKSIVLHFEAVDHDAQVFVNGKRAFEHHGGYDPFEFEIPPAAGEQTLVVRVVDRSDATTQPRGKQVQHPEGIWYTPSSGIWQSVWLEPVPASHLESVEITPLSRTGSFRFKANVEGSGRNVRVHAHHDPSRFEQEFAIAANTESEVELKGAPTWSPAAPNLIDLEFDLVDDSGASIDHVRSYCGLRTIRVQRDAVGVQRIALNDEFLFQYGTLDQGFWPDGLYTPPSDAAIVAELTALKDLGFNMIRKHVKVESRRFYAACDRIGLLVWQDMPSGDRNIGPNDPDIVRDDASRETYEREWRAIIDTHYDSPSIVMWVPFNEGWGQFDTARIAEWTRRRDPSRMVDATSGWAERGVGDVSDWHVYPGPGMPPIERDRALVLGEFGGLGLPIEGHTWLPKGNWGYRSYDSRDALTSAYVDLVRGLRFLIDDGLSAAVYTQTSDVEVEVNGLFTYDREIEKLDAAKIKAAHATLYLPLARFVTLAETGDQANVAWRYTTKEPAAAWSSATFDDSTWSSGNAGFGTRETPGARVGTVWNGSDIWLRRHFESRAVDRGELSLRIHHDEDAEVFLNGKSIAKLEGYTTGYVVVPLDEASRSLVTEGDNVLAVHCRQTRGGQYIDAGLRLTER